ncbi:GGDEF domain-containing response regulator [Alteromonas gilva]|uniref:diguanylate cyclase n=1 Tax=Alteromonas gilva TaxID=2987522 RepID=A0ABT5L170_9ALTE|nr:diguanylate cyclase [Alteromonas gilva]MDC8830775.1 diguanylate cyclase [Alteromonas gilva]
MAKIDTSVLQPHSFSDKTLADCRVLIVDDEEASRLVLSSVLEEFFQCTCIGDSASVIRTCEQIQPDLILLDVNMPGKDGLTLCGELKQTTHSAAIPVMFITGGGDAALQDTCWEAGASDFIAKPVVASTLIHRVKNVLQSKLRLELISEMTFRDQLTGLYNRYYLTTEIPTMLKHLIREQQPLGVIMMDIDNFKGFNDTYGHVEGDKCLHAVATALKSCLRRPQDFAMRYGGEEFLVFLPNTSQEGCETVGNAMVESVQALHITNSISPYKEVTVSAGYIVMQPEHSSKLEDIINQADEQLYEAKAAGKNRLIGRSHC